MLGPMTYGVLSIPTDAASQLLDNLTVAYEFEGDWTDSVGSNDLTPVGSPTFTTGVVGQAGSFVAASDQWASIADNADLSLGDIDFTFEVWCKATTLSSNRGIFGKWNGTVSEYVCFYLTSRFRFAMKNAGGTQTTVVADNLGAPVVDTWYQIVVRHNAATDLLEIIVNNGTPDTAAPSGGVADSDGTFNVANYTSLVSQDWDGLVDSFRLWKGRVLTDADVNELWNGGAGLAYPF